MVEVKKTWETVFFTAYSRNNKKAKAVLELSLNHDTKKYNICSANEEAVSFKDDSIEVAKLKLEALKEAIKYVEVAIS